MYLRERSWIRGRRGGVKCRVGCRESVFSNEGGGESRRENAVKQVEVLEPRESGTWDLENFAQLSSFVVQSKFHDSCICKVIAHNCP